MRLFLSDSFFDKFTELPRNIQQNVRDFQKKFRQNSQSSAIHLESITQFKDSSLKTARVNQEYRAVVGALGQDNYMLLYVDKHDKAYRWAQNKKFVWNEHTQTCQIIPIDIQQEEAYVEDSGNSNETTAESPFYDITDAQLLSIGVPEELIGIVRNIRNFDDLDKAEKKLPQDAFENIFDVMDGNDISSIIANIEEGKAKEGEDTLLSSNNRRRFIEITTDEELARIMDEGMEKWQLFLHPSQRKLVDSDYNGSTKVSGSAGTGKTIAAIHRLKYLCQSNMFGKVLFTTYTTALVENLRVLVDKMGIDKQKYALNNIDKVLLEVAKEYKILPTDFHVLDYSGDKESLALWSEVLDQNISEFDEQFLYSEYIDVIIYNNNKDLKSYLLQARTGRTKPITRKQRVEIWKLKEQYEALKQERKKVDRLELFNMAANYMKEHQIHPYSHVIADEFQDFSNPELRFLRQLVAEGRNDLFLTGDPYQRIYSGRKINFTAAGINIRGKKSKKLKVNYRTTEEIKRMAVAVVKGEKYDDMDGGEENNKGYISLVHGEKPCYRIFASSNEEVEYVIKVVAECENNGISLNHICIAARTRALYKDVVDGLHQNDIPYQELKGGNATGNKEGISLCTFHSLKGLEFRIVILVGVTERSMPSKETSGKPFSMMDVPERKEYLMGIRSLLYVAITRARQMVFISGWGEATGLLEEMECKKDA